MLSEPENGAALADDSRIELFYATNRLPVGPRDHRIYTVAPDRRLHLGQAHAADRRRGHDARPAPRLDARRRRRASRPFIHLERDGARPASLVRRRGRRTRRPPRPGSPRSTRRWRGARDRDILVYVHGANTTVERAAGQAAQLRHFAGRDAVVVLFAWPTAENFLRYSRDIETAFGSAPHLADLIALLAPGTPTARNIDVFTYSAGATVGSDGAGPARRASDRRSPTSLGEVYHAAPDADFRGFVDDLGAYGPRRRPGHHGGQPRRQRAAPRRRRSTAPRGPAGPTCASSRPRPAPPGCSPPPAGGELEIVQVQPGRDAGPRRHLAHLLVRRPLGQQRRARDAALPPRRRPSAGARGRGAGAALLAVPPGLSRPDAGAADRLGRWSRHLRVWASGPPTRGRTRKHWIRSNPFAALVWRSPLRRLQRRISAG